MTKRATTLVELTHNRRAAEDVVGKLTSTSHTESLEAGRNMIAHARELGVSLRDYLRLAIDPRKGDYANDKLDGYETALAVLNLPVADDFKNGTVLQAAAETFQTFAGVRALFPEVIDDVVQWKYRQDNLEQLSPVLAGSRTVNGTQMITTVIDDKEADYSHWGIIAEGARIPVRSIRATEHSVRFFKFGGGYEWTYEFARRAAIDITTPYAARMQREIERGKLAQAISMIINGDAAHAAAPVVASSSIATSIGATHVNGRINWEVLLKWLTSRAQASTPIDTIVGNYDMWFEWTRMFAKPTQDQGIPQMEILARAGVQAAQAAPRFDANITFQVASAAPANQLIGFSKSDTIEELIETGSDIEESQNAIENQKVKYVKTQNAGFRLVFNDTRSILNVGA